VVNGLLETYCRTETLEKVGVLGIIPRHAIDYRGPTLIKMVLDAIIASLPEVAIVDELAHANVPRLNCKKRSQPFWPCWLRKHLTERFSAEAKDLDIEILGDQAL
jgi:K+-sensing histidine kinase KdpD